MNKQITFTETTLNLATTLLRTRKDFGLLYQTLLEEYLERSTKSEIQILSTLPGSKSPKEHTAAIMLNIAHKRQVCTRVASLDADPKSISELNDLFLSLNANYPHIPYHQGINAYLETITNSVIPSSFDVVFFNHGFDDIMDFWAINKLPKMEPVSYSLDPVIIAQQAVYRNQRASFLAENLDTATEYCSDIILTGLSHALSSGGIAILTDYPTGNYVKVDKEQPGYYKRICSIARDCFERTGSNAKSYSFIDVTDQYIPLIEFPLSLDPQEVRTYFSSRQNLIVLEKV